VAGTRRADTRLALAAICLFVVAVGLWNVAHYPPGQGYDALGPGDQISYALGLVPGGHLPPAGKGEYYSPPGYYAIAGSAVWVARKVGFNSYTSLRAAMALNVLFLVGTVLLVARIAGELVPGRQRIAIGAAAFVALLPVVVESEAMFHPEMLSLFLATLAIWLCIRTVRDRRYAVGLGVVLGLGQLERAYILWTVAAAALALVVARRWRSLVVVLVLAALIPAPWYIHQELSYGGQPTFPQGETPQAYNPDGTLKPIYARQPVDFYVDPGLPDVLSAPYRANFENLFVPMTYDGLWGDYFGAWVWKATHKVEAGKEVIPPPPSSTRRRLVLQSIIGLLPTLLAIVGWLAFARTSLRRPPRLVVALVPLIGLLGLLYFTVGYPTNDGANIKTSYMLTTAGAWAIGFGYALDRLRGSAWRLTAALLVVCALVDVTFVVYV
jgi:hypothetical protein